MAMGRWGAGFWVARWCGQNSGLGEGGHLTLQSSLMTRGVSNGECRLGVRIRFLSFVTSWSSGSADGRCVYISI